MKSIWRSLTRYTRRCSCVSRRDHAPDNGCLRGSGLPIPVNGSLITLSIRSNARIATRRSLLTQNRRSSINSGWNTASRATLPCRSALLLLFKSDFLAQSCDGLPSRFPGLCSIHRRQQTFGIFWRPQQMESFEQPRQLIGRDERNVVAAFAADDHDATILCYFVTEFGEVSACSSVSGLNSHEVCII